MQYTHKSAKFKRKMINLDEPIVMGILNVTPDSFFDGGKQKNNDIIVKNVGTMLNNGAAIIDVGGYSSKPNAIHITQQEELKRVLPVVKLLKAEFKDIGISIDTFRSEVAEACINAGANMINDISAGNLDNKMFDCVAKYNLPYVLMHMQGTPQTMQKKPHYNNVVAEIKGYFSDKISQLKAKGVEKIILDLGFGFGKTVEHNYKLLNNLAEFKTFGLPILVGVSRKSMINKVLNISPNEALNGTTVLNTIALLNGAKILRVHDVKAASEAIKLVSKLS